MNLSEAIEAVKISASANSGLVTQDFFNYLYEQLSKSERYTFVSTVAEMGINTRRGSKSIESFVGSLDSIIGDLEKDPFSESKKSSIEEKKDLSFFNSNYNSNSV
jgi:hypothetical protein